MKKFLKTVAYVFGALFLGFVLLVIFGEHSGKSPATAVRAESPVSPPSVQVVQDVQPVAPPAPKPIAWDLKNPDAMSNGNIQRAVRSIKEGTDPLGGSKADASSAVKAPWRFFGTPVCFSGTVGVAEDEPPGSDLAKTLGTSEASEIVMEADDGTVVDLFSMRSSGTLKAGDAATLCGLVVGRAEAPNQMGGKSTHLVLVGVPGSNRLPSSAPTAPAPPISTAPQAATLNSVAQVAQQSGASQASAAGAAPSGSGELNTGTDQMFDTVAGPLGTKEANGADRQLFLNGKPLFNGGDAPYQQPVAKFSLSGARDAVLIASSGGRGNSCEVLYFFVVLGKGAKPIWTPEFGSCAPGGSYRQSGDKISLTIPALGKMETSVFDGVKVTENGKAVVMIDSIDPSR